jgi:hypothetical protein
MRRLLKRLCWSSIIGMIVGIAIALNPAKVDAEILFFDTFEENPTWQQAPWTFEGDWVRCEEGGHPYPLFQAQAHGKLSLWLRRFYDLEIGKVLGVFAPLREDMFNL